jgi:hypothetical protein
VLLGLSAPLTAFGQTSREDPSSTATDERPAEEAATSDDEEPKPSNETEDPCESPEELGESWLDWLNSRTHRTVCESAMWFDSFFGDDRAVEEYSRTGGRVYGSVIYTERDQWDSRFSFNVRVNLPNLDDRWHAFIGRESPDEYLSDTGDRSNPGGYPAGFDDEQQLLVGLGWTPQRDDFDAISFRLGATVSWPPEPYVKMIYRRNHYFSEATSLRWRQTVFWELDDGVGTTTNLDLEHRLSEALLFRWTSTGTISEITEGVEWWTTPTLFQAVSGRNAVAYAVWFNGATDAPVELEEYGVRVVYRRRIAREWLFLDIGPLVSWPRREVEEQRETSWGGLIGFEMQFGHHD